MAHEYVAIFLSASSGRLKYIEKKTQIDIPEYDLCYTQKFAAKTLTFSLSQFYSIFFGKTIMTHKNTRIRRKNAKKMSLWLQGSVLCACQRRRKINRKGLLQKATLSMTLGLCVPDNYQQYDDKMFSDNEEK